jgi:uncharacterized membrane protein
MRSAVTVMIAVAAGAFAFVQFVPSGAASLSFTFGRVLGFAIAPLLFAFVLAWLYGKVRGSPDGALHWRTNWLGLVIAALSILGQIASGAR